MLATDDATIVELPALEHDLPPDEVDARLAAISLAVEQSDTARAFYLHEVETRMLYRGFGHESTAQLAEARHGLAPDLTWRLLRAARVCAKSPVLRAAFERGDIPLYKMDALQEVIGLDEDERWAELASDRSVSKQALRSAVKRRLGEEPDDTFVWIRVKVPPSLFDRFGDGVEKARRYAGAQISEAEALEVILTDWMNTPIDESEQDPELTALDPVIRHRAPGAGEREAAVAGNRELASWSRPTRIGDGPMTREERIDRERRLRLKTLWRSGWRCAACRARCELEVDHIRTRALYPQLIFDESNLCVLCQACHAMKTTGLIRIERNADGTLSITRPSAWNEPPERAP